MRTQLCFYYARLETSAQKTSPLFETGQMPSAATGRMSADPVFEAENLRNRSAFSAEVGVRDLVARGYFIPGGASQRGGGQAPAFRVARCQTWSGVGPKTGRKFTKISQKPAKSPKVNMLKFGDVSFELGFERCLSTQQQDM